MRLSQADHARVSEAVAAAERATDGEIVTVVAQKSDAYHDVALHWAVLAMLLVPGVIALVPQGWVDRGLSLFLGWNAEGQRGLLMLLLFAILVTVFLAVRLLLASMGLRMALTPGSTKTRRVHRKAVQLFRSTCERKTRGRTGVLIYLSLAEHRAEIVADEAIHNQVDPDEWGEAMAALVGHARDGQVAQGMAEAVQLVGEVLARILPRSAGDTNELCDRLIEL